MILPRYFGHSVKLFFKIGAGSAGSGGVKLATKKTGNIIGDTFDFGSVTGKAPKGKKEDELIRLKPSYPRCVIDVHGTFVYRKSLIAKPIPMLLEC